MTSSIGLRMKQHDTAPALRATLTDGGTPIDLTAPAVKVIGKRNGALVFSRAATTKTNLGVVTMTWGPTDTALPGLISIEFELTYPDNTVMTIPPAGYLAVLIDPDLG
jgi:hypothetical protein